MYETEHACVHRKKERGGEDQIAVGDPGRVLPMSPVTEKYCHARRGSFSLSLVLFPLLLIHSAAVLRLMEPLTGTVSELRLHKQRMRALLSRIRIHDEAHDRTSSFFVFFYKNWLGVVEQTEVTLESLI